MRSPHSSATRRRWAEERERKRAALECGEADRPDARAMFLAEGNLFDALAREAKVRRAARDRRYAADQRQLQELNEEAAQRRLEALKAQQAKALLRGELTPEKVGEFREARRLITHPPRRSRKRLADLANGPIGLRGGAGVF